MGTRRLTIGISTAALAAVGAVLFAGVAPAADSGQVVIASYGGSFQDAQTKAYFEPYTKAAGVKIVATSDTSYPKLKAMEESGHVVWDVVSAESSSYVNEVKDGLLQPIDYSVVKADGIPAQYRDKYGVAYIVFGENLAWSKDKFPNGATPAEFFDPKVKARRVLPSDPNYTFEFALLADGVKPGELYPLDVDRALKVIGRVKDQIVAYKGASDMQALIQQGEVDLAYIPNGRVNNAIKAGANWAYGWDAAVSDLERWTVAKGAPNAAGAMKFINFAIEPEQQAALTHLIPYGPTNVDALKLLDPAVAKNLPSDPDNAAKGAILNAQWWSDNLDSVKPRWSTFMMQ
jgi:putative spermidine/putrescine transport system substrate-binding protein